MDALLKVEESIENLRKLTMTMDKQSSDAEVFFDLAIDIFIIADQRRIIKVNEAWESWTGWTKKETVGKEWRDFIHCEEKERIESLVSETMRVNNVIDFINRMKKKNGDWLKIEWRSTRWTRGLTYSVGRPFMRNEHNNIEHS